MFSILHISDLHRSPENPVSNVELLSALHADVARFGTEVPPISRPDAIVVSGDLVMGLPLGDPGHPGALERQYEQAYDFLTRMATVFVDGDRARVVIVPGNHDVDWNCSRAAMTEADPTGKHVPRLIEAAGGPYRWSWHDLRLFRICDPGLYEARFSYFCEMYSRFYAEARTLVLPVAPHRPWNLFSLHDGRICVCAFNSCIRNDCFSRIGMISQEAIAQSHLELLALARVPQVKIAVWHHDVEGSPFRDDYMDPDTVKVMIDRGYYMAMHGHRHRSHTSPHTVFTSDEFMMPVVSAGSLCAAGDNLPPGVRRQYNMVELREDGGGARIHVREVQANGIFGRGRLDSAGGRSYIDVEWKPVPRGEAMNPPRDARADLSVAEQAEKFLAENDPMAAIRAIEVIGEAPPGYLRRLLLRALDMAGLWPRVTQVLQRAETPEELTLVIKALIHLRQWPEAEARLVAAERSGLFDTTTIQTLAKWLAAEKGIHP